LSDKERAELYIKQEEARQRAEKQEEEERDRVKKVELARKQEEERKKRIEEEMKMTPDQRKAIALKEDGNEFFKKKEWTKALELYEQAHRLDPNNIVYQNNISAVYLEMKEFDKCIEICNRAIDIGHAH